MFGSDPKTLMDICVRCHSSLAIANTISPEQYFYKGAHIPDDQLINVFYDQQTSLFVKHRQGVICKLMLI